MIQLRLVLCMGLIFCITAVSVAYCSEITDEIRRIQNEARELEALMRDFNDVIQMGDLKQIKVLSYKIPHYLRFSESLNRVSEKIKQGEASSKTHEAEISDVRNKLAACEDGGKAAQSQFESLRKDLQSAQARSADLETELKSARANAQYYQNKLQTSQSDLGGAEMNLSKMQTRLDTCESGKRTLENRLNECESKATLVVPGPEKP